MLSVFDRGLQRAQSIGTKAVANAKLVTHTCRLIHIYTVCKNRFATDVEPRAYNRQGRNTCAAERRLRQHELADPCESVRVETHAPLKGDCDLVVIARRFVPSLRRSTCAAERRLRHS